MARNNGTAKVARDYVASYSEMPSRTLARLMLKQQRPLFTTLNAALCAVRYQRGARGAEYRKIVGLKAPVGPQKYNPFTDLPKPLREGQDWCAYQLSGRMRVAILSDIHIPYQDQAALVVALNHIYDWKPTHLLLDGDIADFFSVSSWEKDPRARNFKGERDAVVKFLRSLRSAFKTLPIIFKDGNHEDRLARYMRLNAKELLGLEEFELEGILKLGELGITRVKENRPILLGEHLNVVHGHEFSFAISSPVNPARGFYMKAKANVIGGHLHRTSEHAETDLNGKVVGAWSMGCLCNRHPEYARINNWNCGFATVEVSANGNFRVNNHKIIRGVVY